MGSHACMVRCAICNLLYYIAYFAGFQAGFFHLPALALEGFGKGMSEMREYKVGVVGDTGMVG